MSMTKTPGEAYPWRPDRTDPELRALADATRRPRRTVLRLWLPLTPLFVLLAPFALILAPLICLYPTARGVSPWRAAWAVGAVLLSMGGTVIHIDSRDATIRVRIF
jgi:hypothetical protein